MFELTVDIKDHLKVCLWSDMLIGMLELLFQPRVIRFPDTIFFS